MFFVQDQVQKNNNAVLFLFIVVLCFNVFFLSLWLFRFASVLLRINIDKLRQYLICSWLNHVKMLSYEEDLDLFINKQKEEESSSPIKRQFNIQNESMINYAVPTTPPNKLFINHNDLLKLPKSSFRNAIKK